MRSRKSIKILILSISSFFVSSSLFMNCASDSLPPEVTANQSQSTPRPPLSAFYSPNPLPVSSTATISVTGGTPPYTLVKESGAGTLNGYVYSAPSSTETATIRITDAAGAVTMLAINVETVTSPVTPGEMVFNTAGTWSFTVPVYNNLKVEVWGAGGGGQSCGVLNGVPTCVNGGAGGNSSFDVLLAQGGQGVNGGMAQGGDINLRGESGNWNGSNCNGLGGASGGPFGTATRQGGAPGGGGNGFCYGWGANGGGGGGYTVKNYTANALAVGSVIPVKVGAGGSNGGATGRVRITWN